eukprot:332571_1
MSDHPTKKLYDEMDFRIFGEQGPQKCDQDCDDPIEGCIVLKRLVTALAYYSRLDVQNSEDGQQIFIAFIKDVYPHILEDYAHLVKNHTNLESINNALRAKEIFGECEVTQCACTARHQSRENTNTISKQSMDATVQFYSQRMDSLHFYLLHLFECGLRTPNVTPNDDEDEKDMYFDQDFARISTLMNERAHIRLSFDRFKNSTKFNIKTETHEEAVYMDELFRHLLRMGITIENIAAFIISEEYDTEAMKRDIYNHTSQSNIANNMADNDTLKAIAEFVKSTELSSSSFNVGITFYYWSHYENMDQFDENTNEFNLNDHSGHKISDLFVKQKHATFKDEIMNYDDQFMNHEMYQKMMVKAEEFIKCEFVKKMKAFNTKETPKSKKSILLRYGIAHGAMILRRHLLSLMLYTDCSRLCTHFSATFRPVKQFESLSSIKARNSQYWWMAKSLREAVELYGESARIHAFNGPFYCGLSTAMPIPEFQIRLCGPTSASYKIEIARHFGGSEGVILQLNNNIGIGHGCLTGFQCGGISRFTAESEVLFMGGHYRIQIESVRTISNPRNFEVFFSALCKFNLMFNGDHSNELSRKEKVIICRLIEWILEGKDAGKIDPYVLDTFQAFVQEKAHIVFNYPHIHAFNDAVLNNIIFHPMRMTEEVKPTNTENINIFKKDLFRIFKNVNNIELYTTAPNGYPGSEYALSLSALLNEFEMKQWKQLKQVIVKAAHFYGKGGASSWISAAWHKSCKTLQKEYRKKGVSIRYAMETNVMGRDVDTLIINSS